MRVVAGQNKRALNPRSVSGQRAGLLAKIHVAKAQSATFAKYYDDILLMRFGVTTAKALSIKELEQLVNVAIEEHGWVPSYHKKHGPSQVAALQERIWQVADEIPNGRGRLTYICKDICGVEQVSWCHDHKLLTRLLAVMENIKRRGVPRCPHMERSENGICSHLWAFDDEHRIVSSCPPRKCCWGCQRSCNSICHAWYEERKRRRERAS